jgi:flagellar biogenesis protein FliO
MVDGPSTVELLVRLVFSLGIIVGLLVVGAKIARRNGRGLRLPGLPAFGGKREPAIEVIERQSITRNASVAVVRVGDRTLVVGVTEHEVSLLTDQVGLDPTDAGTDVVTDQSVSFPQEPAPPAGSRPVTQISAVREAKGMLPLAPGSATLDVAVPDRPTRMSFVDALREMTVRSA